MTTSGRAEDIIERLHGLYPKLIDLSLERLQRLLAALGKRTVLDLAGIPDLQKLPAVSYQGLCW